MPIIFPHDQLAVSALLESLYIYSQFEEDHVTWSKAPELVSRL